MDNVIKTLKLMADHGGYWYYGTYAGACSLDLYSAGSVSGEGFGFTQDELREFLKQHVVN